MTLADLHDLPPVIPLYPDAANLLDIGRSKAYSLARRGEFPVRLLRLGNQYRVPTADLLRHLGIQPLTSA